MGAYRLNVNKPSRRYILAWIHCGREIFRKQGGKCMNLPLTYDQRLSRVSNCLGSEHPQRIVIHKRA